MPVPSLLSVAFLRNSCANSAHSRFSPSNVVLGIVPLVAGVRRFVPDEGSTRGAAIELVIIGWDLRAGTVLGPGDFGSRVTLAWRIASSASPEFAPPPINANLARRLAQSGGTTIR